MTSASSHFSGGAALVWDSRALFADGAARLRLGTTRRSSLHLERRRASNARAARLNLGAPAARRPYLGFTSALPRYQHFSDCIEGNGD
ncbi:MAG: hypothetical protein EBY32_15020 [Proteobacteria bacterium]|nr:hypothetical protein [Pseudomonadota bacterium]